MKRIAFYLFYDEQGIIDNYIIYKLECLKKHVDHVVFIVNGLLTPESRNKIKPFSNTLFCRENKGFDVWGYKEGLELIGEENLKEYDELILLNYTFFGPIFPFEELFTWSESQKVEFWGISDHDTSPHPNIIGSELPRHIQSHFIAIRHKMFDSPEFKLYWKNMPMISSYQESVLQHESRFTKHFTEKGYLHKVYIDCDQYTTVYPTIMEVVNTLKNRSPILKRRIFFQDPLWVDFYAINIDLALHYIKNNSRYDLDLAYRNLLRTTKPKDLATNLTLLKIFDDEGSEPLQKIQKIAVLANIYSPDMLLEILSYTENIPQVYDLYITTGCIETKKNIDKQLVNWRNDNRNCIYTEVRVTEKNRGRDVSALFITMKDVVLNKNYDYLCRLHSEKPPQLTDLHEENFKRYMLENVLKSPLYVTKLLNFMFANKHIGLAMPSMLHLDGFSTLGHAWFANKPGSITWAKKLKISLPLDDFSPHAPYGTMYWFRPEALRNLFAYEWKWEDFNEEPHHVDGSLAHILERLLGYAAHNAGYMAYNIMCSKMAEKSYMKLEYKAGRLLSLFPSGNVLWETLQLEHQRKNSAHHDTVKISIKKLILAFGRSINFRLPTLARMLKPLYFRVKRLVK